VLLCLVSFASEVQGRYKGDPSWLIGDCVTYRAIVRGITDQHTLDQSVTGWDRTRYVEGHGQNVLLQNSTVALTTDGRLVPKHPVLFAAVLVPPYALAREWGLLAFNVLQCGLLVLLVYWLAKLTSGERPALIAACVFLAFGIIRNYSYNVSPDCFGAVLALGGLVLVWTPGAGPVRLALGGALMGLALWMRPLNLVILAGLLPALVAAIHARKLLPALRWPAVGFAVTAGAYLLLDAWWFGSPFVTSYDRIVVMKDGVRSLATTRDCLNRPFFASLAPTFFDPAHGFFQTAPWWPVFLVALVPLGRPSWPRAVALAAIVFAPVFFIVRYDFWDSSHYGNRFFLLPAAVASVGVAWAAARVGVGAQPERAAA
jgi:4-amino-4-deoxy-L-arabinose transferase-like glycosyltransferase